MVPPEYQPILFTYDISVFGRRVDFYLALRGFQYARVVQPNMMPRPDLTRLGIQYRRIPIMAIGRDIYCDSRLIIEKMEKLFPEHNLGSTNAYEQGLEEVVQHWIYDAGLFWHAAALIPPDLDIMVDKKWTDDRQEMIGRTFSSEMQAAGRPRALAAMRSNFGIIEHGLLADGRKYLLGGDLPSLADVHAVTPIDWTIGKSMKMGENLDTKIITESQFPRLYAWVTRFRQEYENSLTKTGSPEVLSSDHAINKILESGFWEREHTVDELDPLRLKKGQMVRVYPLDTGFNYRDEGVLVSLNQREVVIESKINETDGCLRLHFPRWNFQIEPL